MPKPQSEVHKRLHQAIENMPDEHLPLLLQFLDELEHEEEQDTAKDSE